MRFVAGTYSTVTLASEIDYQDQGPVLHILISFVFPFYDSCSVIPSDDCCPSIPFNRLHRLHAFQGSGLQFSFIFLELLSFHSNVILISLIIKEVQISL
jgi:hypothetical protein